MKESHLRGLTGLVLVASVTGSLMWSATELSAYQSGGRSYSEPELDNEYRGLRGRTQWDVTTGHGAFASGPKTETDALRDSHDFRSAIIRQGYLVDCLAEPLAEIAAAVPDWGDYADAKQILLAASAKLRSAERTNASPSGPPIRVQGRVNGKQIRTRPLTPVREDRGEALKQQAVAIPAEVETKFLCFAETSDRRWIAYAEVAKVVGLNKTLSRSA